MKIRELILLFHLFLFSNIFAFSASPNDSTLLKKRISLIAKNANLIKIIQTLEDSYHLNFSYGSQAMLDKGRMNLSANQLPLGKVLDRLLLPYKLNYKIIGNHLVIVEDTFPKRPAPFMNDALFSQDTGAHSIDQKISSQFPDGFVYSSRSWRKYQKYLKKLQENELHQDTSSWERDTSHLLSLNKNSGLVKTASINTKRSTITIGGSLGLAQPLTRNVVQLKTSRLDEVQVADKKWFTAGLILKWNSKGPFFLLTGLGYNHLYLSGSLVRDTMPKGPDKITINRVSYTKALSYAGIPIKAGVQWQKKHWNFSFAAGIIELILFSENFLQTEFVSMKVENKPMPPTPLDSARITPAPPPTKNQPRRDVTTILAAERFCSLIEADLGISYTFIKRLQVSLNPVYAAFLTSMIKEPQQTSLRPAYFGFKFGLYYTY